MDALICRDSLDQVAVSLAVPKSPGIPVDFEVQAAQIEICQEKENQWWLGWWSNHS